MKNKPRNLHLHQTLLNRKGGKMKDKKKELYSRKSKGWKNSSD